jgi:ketosteroid isomerase-like protein
VTPTPTAEAVQAALDALVYGDEQAVTSHFTTDMVMTGARGCFAGRVVGVRAVLDRFAELARLTGGTFGTEVEAVYTGVKPGFVVITRHWASIDGTPVQGAQALLVATKGDRIRAIDALSNASAGSGIWD